MVAKRKRQPISSVMMARHLLWCSLMLLPTARAFLHRSRIIRTRQKLLSTTIPDPSSHSLPAKIEGESNFWRSIVRRGDDADSMPTRIPCDPSLDAEGPLPAGAYQTLGKEEYEPKPTCRLSIAVDTSESQKPDLSRLHQFIDCGLNTFQLTNQHDKILYRQLQADTPDTVLRTCQFVIPFQTPSSSVMAQPSILRDTVLQALHRSGGDCIDTLQLEYTKGTQYHLDVLDVLTELQREGLLRAIATKDFPPNLLRKAASCGFMVTTNQITLSLLDPTTYTKKMQLVCADLGIQLVVASPLAGGMLTNKFTNIQYEPQPWELSTTERNYLYKVVSPWARKHSHGGDRWNVFQKTMMDTLDDIALKHRVLIESVALRWTMQLDHVASVLVPCELGNISDDRPFDRPTKLREVFRFELDEDDMERLWDTSGEIELVKIPEFNPEISLENADFEGMEVNGDTLFLPNLSDKKLWL